MTRIIKCSECGNNIGSGSFLNDGQNCKTCERERDKRDLEQKINSYQYSLRRIKSMRNHPSYDEYQVQELERQLAEAEAEYREKYGELPLSLRDGGGGVKFTQQRIPQRWKRKELCSINSASGNCSSSNCFWINYLLSVAEKERALVS